METKIYLIRHGESEQNVDDVFSGITDVPLSEKGIQQCLQLSHYFKNVHIDKIYVSPLQRAYDSASYIFPWAPPNIQISQHLIEFNYGIYDGYSRARFSSDNDIIIQQWLTAPSNLTFPGGGNIMEHAKKSFEGIMELIAENKSSSIALVSHRTTIRLIVATVIGLDYDKFRLIPCSNCSITELVFTEKLYLDSLNLTAKYIVKS